jgi:drug/metabolite transporter (DMT)-like permease
MYQDTAVPIHENTYLKSRELKADFLLLITAFIWGSAFVAQKAGLEFIGPFIFNTLRFALGCLVLLPLIIIRSRNPEIAMESKRNPKRQLTAGLIAGIFVFFGATFQQTGLLTTSAGKAGFITGLYVIIVPILGLFWRHRISPVTWVGAILAVIGLYFLSVTETLSVSVGDLLVLACAFVWAGHVHVIGYYSPKVDTIKLAFTQFAVCSLISLVLALVFDEISLTQIRLAAVPVLYAGMLSVGVAYTMQIVAQRDAPPAHAAIIMSLEAVFAVLGGWVMLHERLSTRGIFGCALMLTGMLLSQGGRLRGRQEEGRRNSM